MIQYLIKQGIIKKIKELEQGTGICERTDILYVLENGTKKITFWDYNLDSKDIKIFFKDNFPSLYSPLENSKEELRKNTISGTTIKISVLFDLYRNVYMDNPSEYYLYTLIQEGVQLLFDTIDIFNLEEYVNQIAVLGYKKELTTLCKQLIENKKLFFPYFLEKKKYEEEKNKKYCPVIEKASYSYLYKVIAKSIKAGVEKSIIKLVLKEYGNLLIVKELKIYYPNKNFGFTTDNIFFHKNNIINYGNFSSNSSDCKRIIPKTIDYNFGDEQKRTELCDIILL